jgi:5-methylcytosine-specific restriction endonuclease McrA
MKNSIKNRVYIKYNKKCAYCGNNITFEEMSIDHLEPKSKGGLNELENLMPSCEICNHYKNSHNINKFRYLLQNIIKKIKKLYIVKVAIRFGLIEFKEFKSFFYEKDDID